MRTTGAVTVTVELTVVAPDALLARSEYVVVAVGDTVFEPLAATVAPSSVTVVALVVDQVNVADWPL